MKQFFVRWMMAVLLMPGLVHSQALPSAVQKSVSGIMQQKMAQRGFASNDPRWGATLQSAGSGIAGAAAAAAVVTVAGVTAPAWITAAATVALGALFAAGIDLAIDGVRWLMNSDGSVTYTSSAASGLAPDECWYPGYGGSCYASWRDMTGADSMTCSYPSVYSSPEQCSIWLTTTYVMKDGHRVYRRSKYTNDPVNYDDYSFTVSTVKTNAGYAVIPATVPDQPPEGGGTVTQSPTAAVVALSEVDKAKPANPAVLAAIADGAWKTASVQPGYSGYPYDPSDPITASDASAWMQANPSAWPTVGDIVNPQVAPSGSASEPFQLPNSAAEPVTSPGTTPQQPGTGGFDFGIPATNEAVPKQTVPVSFTPTVFAAPTGCPAPVTFEMFGKPYAISYSPFCDLMATLAPIFLAVGAAAAALIFAESLKS